MIEEICKLDYVNCNTVELYCRGGRKEKKEKEKEKEKEKVISKQFPRSLILDHSHPRPPSRGK